MGDNGIITQAQIAKLETRGGEVEEKVNLWKTEVISSEYTNTTVKTDDELLEEMKADKILYEKEIDRENKIITIGSRIIDYNILTKVTDNTPGEMDGDGTEENPYKIQSIEDLYAFSYYTNKVENIYNGKYISLENSLDFKENASYCDPQRTMLVVNGETIFGDETNNVTIKQFLNEDGFNPIGEIENAYINGNNITIYNIYICNPITKYGYIGLFSTLYNEISFKNLNLTGNIVITEKYDKNLYIGSLSGELFYNNSSIDNCNSSVDITIGNQENNVVLGGLFGDCESLLTHSSYSGNIKVYNCVNVNVGGIVGYRQNDNVEYCKNTGNIDIEVPDNATYIACGGIAWEYDDGRGVVNSANYANINIKGTGIYNPNSKLKLYVGGITGETWGKLIENCYNSGNINITGCTFEYCDIGGISGGIDIEGKNILSKGNINLEKCFAIDTAEIYIGGIGGSAIDNRCRLESVIAVNDINVDIVNNSKIYVGGLFSNVSSDNVELKNNVFTGKINCKQDAIIGGLIGKLDYKSSNIISKCYFLKNDSTINATGESNLIIGEEKENLADIYNKEFLINNLGFDNSIWQIENGEEPKLILKID